MPTARQQPTTPATPLLPSWYTSLTQSRPTRPDLCPEAIGAASFGWQAVRGRLPAARQKLLPPETPLLPDVAWPQAVASTATSGGGPHCCVPHRQIGYLHPRRRHLWWRMPLLPAQLLRLLRAAPVLSIMPIELNQRLCISLVGTPVGLPCRHPTFSSIPASVTSVGFETSCPRARPAKPRLLVLG